MKARSLRALTTLLWMCGVPVGVGMALTGAGRSIPATHRLTQTDEHGEALERLLARRLAITHERPILVVCDSVLARAMTHQFRARLLKARLIQPDTLSCGGRGDPKRVDGAVRRVFRVAGFTTVADTMTVTAWFITAPCHGQRETAQFIRAGGWRLSGITFGNAVPGEDCISATHRKGG